MHRILSTVCVCVSGRDRMNMNEPHKVFNKNDERRG